MVAGSSALVVTVWERLARFEGGAWLGEIANTADVQQLDREAARAARVAADGVRIAQEAGLEAEPLAVQVTGSVWKTILNLADEYDAATIVMGSRGLTGLRSVLLGSVSRAVAGHADRPTLIIRRSAVAA
jgi:nucleotide-binding universal stress UspA family protein